jgi:hypothetical protein
MLGIQNHRVLGLASSVLVLLMAIAAPAGATWSIVAVDSQTREVGVAGASCIGGVEVIAGIAPGRGVVAAQAMSNLEGRARAVELLEKGRQPSEILEEIASQAWDPRTWPTRPESRISA